MMPFYTSSTAYVVLRGLPGRGIVKPSLTTYSESFGMMFLINGKVLKLYE